MTPNQSQQQTESVPEPQYWALSSTGMVRMNSEAAHWVERNDYDTLRAAYERVRGENDAQYEHDYLAPHKVCECHYCNALRRAEKAEARLRWLANRVLACDYGDNDRPGEIGWRIVHNLLPKQVGERQPAFMFGSSIDAAIDAAQGGGE